MAVWLAGCMGMLYIATTHWTALGNNTVTTGSTIQQEIHYLRIYTTTGNKPPQEIYYQILIGKT
jgi:hypothetical protein